MRPFPLALAGLLLFSVPAMADTLNFNVTGRVGGYTGSAVFTGTGNGDGSYTITSITGPAALGPITVLPVDSFLLFNDNLFFPASPTLVDLQGIAFAGSFGEFEVFGYNGRYGIVGFDANDDPVVQSIRLTLDSTSAVTPEPSSILLTMTGLVGAAAFAEHKRTLSRIPARTNNA